MENPENIASEKQDSILGLPKRPTARRPEGERSISLISNLHQVKINLKTKVYCYHIDFFPQIEADNRAEKTRILNKAGDQIKAKVGQFAYSGQNLYGITEPAFEGGVEQPAGFVQKQGKKVQEQVWLRIQDGDIFVRIRHVSTINMEDLKKSRDRFCMPIQFLNKLLNTLLLPLGLKEAGKTGIVVDNSSRQFLPSGLYLYNGYSTAFDYLQSGLFLKVDTCTKIVRSKSLLEGINEMYHAFSYLDKNERRDKVKEEFLGKIVMANYGNSKHWRVEDIIFDQDASQYKIEQGGEHMSLVEYFRSKYQLDVKILKQPLVKSRMSRHDKRECFLLPEFLLMTGMPENDQRLRREVSQVTIRPPDEKLRKINTLMSRLESSTAELSLTSLHEKLGLEIQTTPHPVKGIILSNPQLVLGRGREVDQNRISNFNFRSMPIYDSQKQVNLTLLYFPQVDIQTLERSLAKLATEMSIQLVIKLKKMTDYKNNQSLQDIKEQIFKYINTDHDSIVLLILPNPLKTSYRQIKKWSLNNNNPLLTQVVLEATLKKKGLDSILTKVLLQVSAKVGNTLWVAQASQKPQRKIMFIGVHQTAKSGNKIVTGFSSTISDTFQQYFSQSFVSSKGTTCIIEKMQEVIGQSLKAWVERNKDFPEEIIILRNGCTDNQEKIVLTQEVQQVLSFLEMNSCPSKLTYISIDAKPSHKFFLQKDGRVQNPPCGTIVNESVVSQGYDFYLYPAQCNMGAASPVRYKVLYINSKMSEAGLQSLLYSQCFNYANWTGSIRFPSCLQYSKKLSQFVSEQIDESLTSDKLGRNLYFI